MGYIRKLTGLPLIKTQQFLSTCLFPGFSLTTKQFFSDIVLGELPNKVNSLLHVASASLVIVLSLFQSLYIFMGF